MTDLDKLIEAVEGGDAKGVDFICLSAAEHAFAYKAHHGSLDAAKALHEALLPGWIFDVTNDSAFVMRSCQDVDWTHDFFPQYFGENDNPARAWLIAILKAHRAALANGKE